MSTEQNTIVNNSEDITDDLDAFSADFHGQTEADTDEVATSDSDESEDVVEADAPTEDTHEGEDDTPDTDEETAEVEDEPKPKKNRFQERIDELTGKQREAERRAQALEAELEKLKTPEPTPTPKVEAEFTGPDPEDKNEDGTDKYPLGEFDKNYIRDLTKYTLAEERAAMKAQEAQEAEANKLRSERQVKQVEWEEKLVPAQERYPDFHERGEALISTLGELDHNYSEYLAQTIMSLDNGTDVFYYLSQNPEEAATIVKSGATKATITLGRLDARFDSGEEEAPKPRPKVTKAPTPPPQNKGSSAAVVEVADDTDDLDAFAQKYFNKRRS